MLNVHLHNNIQIKTHFLHLFISRYFIALKIYLHNIICVCFISYIMFFKIKEM